MATLTATTTQPLTTEEAMAKINEAYSLTLKSLAEWFEQEKENQNALFIYNTYKQKARLKYNTAIEKLNRITKGL